MPYYNGYNGAVKEVTQLPTGYNGAVVQANSLYGGYNGAKELVFGRYRWEKWDVKINALYKMVFDQDNSLTYSRSSPVVLHKEYSFDENTGNISFLGGSYNAASYTSVRNLKKSGYVWIANMKNSRWITGKVTGSSDAGSPYFFVQFDGYKKEQTNVESKGDNLLGTVQSDNPSAYPENGIKDGFWYVKIQ